jgi:hypothetical protein
MRHVTQSPQDTDGHGPSVEAAVVNALAQEHWQTSEDHGFHEDWKLADWLGALSDYLSKEERFTTDVTFLGCSTVDGLKLAAEALRNNVVATKLLLIITEICEAVEPLRDLGVDKLLNPDFSDEAEQFGEELADAEIRIGDVATALKIALGDLMVRKMARNAERPFKHGRQF